MSTSFSRFGGLSNQRTHPRFCAHKPVFKIYLKSVKIGKFFDHKSHAQIDIVLLPLVRGYHFLAYTINTSYSYPTRRGRIGHSFYLQYLYPDINICFFVKKPNYYFC